MHLYRKRLEPDRRIQRDLFDLCPPGLKHVRRNQLVVIAEAQIDHGASGQRFIHHKLCRDIHVVSDVFHLPGHGVAGSQSVDCLVKALDTGTDVFQLIHVDTPSFQMFQKANKRRLFGVSDMSGPRTGQGFSPDLFYHGGDFFHHTVYIINIICFSYNKKYFRSFHTFFFDFPFLRGYTLSVPVPGYTEQGRTTR